MVHKSDEKKATGEQPGGTSEELTNGVRAESQKRESLEENLEKLAALNLIDDQSLQPRYSTAIIRMISALAGIVALVLIYLILKLFI
jgi:hypothetical protein